MLNNNDVNGTPIEVGSTVRYGDTTGRVLIVHDEIPGTRSTAEGIAVAYVEGVGFYGDNRAVRCDELEVVS